MEQIPPRLKLVILAVCLAIPTVLVAVFAGDTIFFWLVLAVVGAVATPIIHPSPVNAVSAHTACRLNG